MTMIIKTYRTCLFLSMLLSVTFKSYASPIPLLELITTPVGAVKSSSEIKMPMLTWGGDAVTIYANGNSTATQPDSLFAKAGLNIKLARQDNFQQQLQEYISGETPFLRCTVGMCNQAIELLSQDPRTKPVIIYQLTWSKGSDGLVAKKGLMNVKYLKGKTISLQAYGPHVDFLTTILDDKNISLNDVTLDWQPDLTLSEASPPAAFLNPNIDAAFMILPDALTLTSNRRIGTGKRGSVRGARLITSTMFAKRIIADVYVVRSDFLHGNREKVSKIVSVLMKGQQQVSKLMKDLNATNRPEFLTSSAEILLDDKQAIGDLEELILDTELVDSHANRDFLQNSDFKYNHEVLSKRLQASFNDLELIEGEYPFLAAQWEESELY